METRNAEPLKLSRTQRTELRALAEIIRLHRDWLWLREHREMLARIRRRIVEPPPPQPTTCQ